MSNRLLCEIFKNCTLTTRERERERNLWQVISLAYQIVEGAMWWRIVSFLVLIAGLHSQAYAQRPFPSPNKPEREQEEKCSEAEQLKKCDERSGGGGDGGEMVTLGSLVFAGQRWLQCWIIHDLSASGNIGIGNYGSVGGSFGSYVLIKGRRLYDVKTCKGPGKTCILGSVKLIPISECEPVKD